MLFHIQNQVIRMHRDQSQMCLVNTFSTVGVEFVMSIMILHQFVMHRGRDSYTYECIRQNLPMEIETPTTILCQWISASVFSAIELL